MVQRRGRRGIRGAAALVALLFLLLASDAQAATIPVTTTQDELNADGDCSLREAIEAANTNAAVDSCTAGSGADIVSLAAATYALSVTGTLEDANATGDLDITSDVTISGAGSTHSVIDADGIDRVLDVRSSSSLTINRARVTDGCAAPEPTSAAGGGVRVTSGSSLAVTRAELRGNILCAGGEGGGIYVDSGASATLDKSTLAQNSAGNNGGGIAVYGSVTVTESTFSGNEAGNGGGIYNNQGTATITNSTFSGNKANTDGGGLAVAGPSGTTTLMHVTVAGNSAHNFGLTGDGGGLRIYSGANITLNSSLIADNSVASPGQGPDCFGAVTTSNGRNLVEDTTGCTGLAGGDLTGQDPALSPLANNGGPTKTRAIAATSPAIDAAGPGCPPPATDQRGVTRAQGAACDIGAFERESAPVGTTIAVDTTQDELNGDGDCSLREA
ncbi:MAG TPA: choice-of-anchor Q domain-containing protein, partial [Solirubrobacterales bacterium]|nr:choice-of-anchor Q domain-containing protein [Solirubrobacterales bacterium]